MIDPTAPADLDSPLDRIGSGTDPEFAARAAQYLRDQGLDSQAIVVALRTEFELPTSDAIELAGHQLSRTQSTTKPQATLASPTIHEGTDRATGSTEASHPPGGCEPQGDTHSPHRHPEFQLHQRKGLVMKPQTSHIAIAGSDGGWFSC